MPFPSCIFLFVIRWGIRYFCCVLIFLQCFFIFYFGIAKYICIRTISWQPITDYFCYLFFSCGGWLDGTSIYTYINLSFCFLYGQYVLLSKLNGTSKKSISVRLVTISIFKSIFLKILIAFFRTLSVYCLFILRRINNPFSLYRNISFESIFGKRDCMYIPISSPCSEPS